MDDVDFSVLSFDAWLKFFFELSPTRAFTWTVYDISDARRHLEHYIRFCEEARAILWLYKADASRIESVTWKLTHGTANVLWSDRLTDDIWLPEARPTHRLRLQALEAMAIPYEDVYRFIAEDFVGSAFFMWWEAVIGCFRGAYDRPAVKGDYQAETPEEIAERDAIMDTLERILAIDSLDCQLAACHGLNHLSHPRRAEVVEAFIKTYAADGGDPDTLRWLYTCRDGEAM